ncbi:MAG: protein translocase subunit SecD [Candidatus Nanopelagicales bacterium]|nr:protein translocase subunit SecD [Candidatus Nanopelagicales bacterium]
MIALMAGLAVWAFWPGQEHTPRLGLDLRGGTQVVMLAQSVDNEGSITDEQLAQTVEIIRQRVNGLGVAEAEVTTQGSGGNAAVVVSVPGVNSEQLAAQLSQTALLDFRPVVMEDYGSLEPPVEPEAVEPGPSPSEQATLNNKANKKSSKGQSAPLAPAAPAKKSTPAPVPSVAPAAPAESMSPPIQMDSNNAALQAAFRALDCSKPENHRGGVPDDPAKWLVTCAKDGQVKYLLEPAFLRGTQVTNAQAGLPETGGGGWQVNLTFDSEGANALADVSTKLSKLPPPQNQFAIVLDGLVQSSPYFQEPILGGQAQISGSFTAESAKALANVLKYGALPVSLTIGEVTSLSPTLGTDQLQAALLAGAIGLALVVLYLFFYYRLLGGVAVVSLAAAALITYCVFVVLGRQIGMALTLAGVAGAIVAIGITADSFIVYFERIRDEIRDGRSLRAACEAGWVRARNTLLAADFVSLLGAAILYYLSIGNVRGFAFVLGLTTIIDVIVAFMFTRPIVAIIARSERFQRGGSWTGLSAARLGVSDLTGRTRSKRSRRAGKRGDADESGESGSEKSEGSESMTVEIGSKGGR